MGHPVVVLKMVLAGEFDVEGDLEAVGGEVLEYGPGCVVVLAVVVFDHVEEGHGSHQVGPESLRVRDQPIISDPHIRSPIPKSASPPLPQLAAPSPNHMPRPRIPNPRIPIQSIKNPKTLPPEYIIISINQHNNLVLPAQLLRHENRIDGNANILQRMHNLHPIFYFHFAVVDVGVDLLSTVVWGPVVDVDEMVVCVVQGLEMGEVDFVEQFVAVGFF